MGRFTIAAKHHETIAGIFESEVADLDKAMQHYEQAADYFKGEESNSSANKCMLKVGTGEGRPVDWCARWRSTPRSWRTTLRPSRYTSR
jgi:hypothetical protein